MISKQLLLVGCLLSVGPPCSQGVAQGHVDKILVALEKPSAQYIAVAAHRTDWRNAPENSLQGLKLCIAMGVDIAEIDVQLTKDKQVVVLHDKTLDRTTTGRGPVKNYTLDSLRKFRLRDGLGVPTRHPIPTLREMLETARGNIVLFIDKAYPCLNQVYGLVQEMGMEKQCLFEGKATLEEFLRDYPALYQHIRYMPRIMENDPNAQQYAREYTQAISPAAFIVSYKDERSPALPLIASLKQLKVPILVSTLWPETCAGHDDDLAVTDPDSTWLWVIDHGANILCTDRPALMLHYLRSKHKHP